MIFCSNCGKELEDDAKFCSACGKETVKKENVYADYKDYANPEDRTFDYDTFDVINNKGYGILSYFGILVLFPILLAPKSKFARFHANQGLVLLILEAAYYVLRTILLKVIRFAFTIPFIGFPYFFYSIIRFLTGLGFVAFFVFIIIGIIDAANGKTHELPIIGKFKLLK